MSTTKIQFDLEKALEALKSGQDLNGKNGFLTPLIKQLTEAALQAERDRHLENSGEPNRKNGYTTKTIKTPSGSFELDTPRDRAGTFEPQLIKKNQTHLTDELERKIISLFAHGNSYQAIRDHIQDMYDMSISNGTLNAITDKLIPEFKSWQERNLDAVYPIVWLDAIHYKIKENGRFVSKALYTLLALNIEGKKELLGLYLSDSEGAHYWLSVLTDLQNRGVNDILIACVDGLKGFPEAIQTIYPNAVEAVHRQFRKLTKTKGGFANENSLLKLLYAGVISTAEKWTHPVQNWNLTLSQMAIHFEGRLDKFLDL